MADEHARDGEVDSASPTPLFKMLGDDGALAAGRVPRASREIALRAYRELKRLRVLDARMMLLQRQGRIGFYGTCTGQEAVPIASALALAPSDWVFQALRESSMMLVRGFPLAKYIAQIFGNSHDDLKGRMQPSHMSSKSVNQVSWSSCIGTQIPQAVGAAWAAKQRKEKTVVLGFMGDGATSEADFHAGLTFAGVFHVPCVLVCQNNHWAISVPAARQTASASFAMKGLAYGVPSFRVDGNDFLAVYEVVSAAAERARTGEGPSFIECLTSRIRAHSSSDDPTRYRSQEEVDVWLKRDPVQRLKSYLESIGALDDAADEKLEKELNEEISQAITEVERHGPPERDTIFDDVYATLPWHLDEQREELRRSPTAPSHG